MPSAEPLTFASVTQENQWESGNAFPPLREVVLDGAEYSITNHGWLWCLTEVWRSLEDDKKRGGHGVHPLWRAVDVRTRDVPPDVVEDVRQYLEKKWIYDPMRPTMPIAYTKPHGDGPHMHCQISVLTRMRNIDEVAPS